MEKVVRSARGLALEFGSHAPMLLICGTEGAAPMMLAEVPEEHEDRVKYMFFAGKHFSGKDRIGKLNKVFLIMEAWMGTNMNVLPSRDPKRIEALIVAYLDILTNEQKVASLEYVCQVSNCLDSYSQYF